MNREDVLAEIEAARSEGCNADLRNVNLRNADLRNVNLRYADLRNANLRYANLRNVNLGGANLRNANLGGANLWGAELWGGVPLSTPSGLGYLVPTPDGWRVTIGCWRDKTLEDLADLIADRAEWPEAQGAERERRRPILAAVLALATAHAEYHANKIESLKERWAGK